MESRRGLVQSQRRRLAASARDFKLFTKIEGSVSSIYLYNWRNPDTHYQSGQEVNVDDGLSYGRTPRFSNDVRAHLDRPSFRKRSTVARNGLSEIGLVR
jgi:hypothetical protein